MARLPGGGRSYRIFQPRFESRTAKIAIKTRNPTRGHFPGPPTKPVTNKAPAPNNAASKDVAVSHRCLAFPGLNILPRFISSPPFLTCDNDSYRRLHLVRHHSRIWQSHNQTRRAHNPTTPLSWQNPQGSVRLLCSMYSSRKPPSPPQQGQRNQQFHVRASQPSRIMQRNSSHCPVLIASQTVSISSSLHG